MKKQQKNYSGDKMRRLVMRNWVIAAVSLGLAILAYLYFK